MSALLQEITIQQLQQNSSDPSNFDTDPTREDRTDVLRVLNMQVVPYENAIMVRCLVKNVTNGSGYQTSILYQDVEIGEEGQFDIDFMATDGVLRSVSRSALENSNVKVSCNCLDFYWTFALWNYNDGSLLGQKPKPYVKLTNRRPRNIRRVPGCCKHIYESYEHMVKHL